MMMLLKRSLIAWLALDSQRSELGSKQETSDLFNSIIKTISHETGDLVEAKYQVLLVAVTALGLGVTGNMLSTLVGLTNDEADRFAPWLAGRIGHLK